MSKVGVKGIFNVHVQSKISMMVCTFFHRRHLIGRKTRDCSSVSFQNVIFNITTIVLSQEKAKIQFMPFNVYIPSIYSVILDF